MRLDASRIAQDALARIARPIEDARGLPANWYTDPEIFALEESLVFRRAWLAVCFTHEVAEPGDVMPERVCGSEIAIVRDHAGTLRAFHNVCRHRASLVVQQAAKRQHSLKCNYHCWTYAMDGRLKNAPFFNGAPVSKGDGDIRLSPIRCEEREGVVFVNLDGCAPGIDGVFEPLEMRWRTYDRTKLQRFATRRNSIPANWKVVMEGLLEVYHEEFIHEDLGYRLTEDGEKNWEDLWTGELMGFRSVTPEEKPAQAGTNLPRLPGMPSTGPAPTEILLMFPNVSFNIFDNHLVQTIWTLASYKETRWKSSWYFAPGAADSASGRTLCQGVVDFWEKIRREDLGSVLSVQAGLESRTAEPIETRYSPFWEPIIQYFHTRVAKALLGAVAA
jgi:choline monooxygenase